MSVLVLLLPDLLMSFFFFFNDTATTEIYTLSLHDALPIWIPRLQNRGHVLLRQGHRHRAAVEQHKHRRLSKRRDSRSEEHTSELQSLAYLVCRLLLEKKKKNA